MIHVSTKGIEASAIVDGGTESRRRVTYDGVQSSQSSAAGSIVKTLGGFCYLIASCRRV